MEDRATSSVPADEMTDMVDAKGSRSMPLWHMASENLSSLTPADISDFAHFLAILHGRNPGVIDFASSNTTDERMRDWLVQAMDGFAGERALITRMTVAAGPIHGITAEDDSSVAIHNHGRALELLARSERRGCALGAAFALVIDWWAMREVLDAIAWRLDIENKDSTLPGSAETASLAQLLAGDRMLARSINFGASQMLIQHRGFWDLLAARRKARLFD